MPEATPTTGATASSILPTDPAVIQARLAKWRKHLQSPTELQLPTDYPRPIPLKVVEGLHEFVLPDPSGLAVLQLSLTSQQVGSDGDASPTSPFTVLLAAFVVLLHRYTAEEDIVVGSSSESSNPLVLRINVKPTDTFLDVLNTVREVEKEALENEIPFDILVSDLLGDLAAAAAAGTTTNQGPENGALAASNTNTTAQSGPNDAAGGNYERKAPSSLFRVRFFNQTDTDEQTLNKTITAATDLTVIIRQKSTESLRRLYPSIEIQITYNQVLFSSNRIVHIGQQLQKVLAAALSTSIATQAGQVVGEDHHIGNFDIVTEADRAVLPDPEANLNWSSYPGSITSIFVKNATSNPDKPFVTESVLRPDPVNSNKTKLVSRTFTYKQIYKAARIVSRYLQQCGIQREDVVVVYAYRGVDLVISILGVLMAGATYSVIDPAYPPARQNIYLSVAKPRGLVIIEQAGTLSEEVQKYADDELDVVCVLPALFIQDSGDIHGGILSSSNGQDVLQKAASEVEASINDPTGDLVEVGPDSVATLSFTSGSTGIPKGVRGRHYSLTHFYPWMGEQFNITEKSRFTMLSGIAHDPIQRDVFTPAFFGAELYIPTSEDIGIPGQLAQWMAQNSITITHLTPAMGQLLSANATANISNLRHAFFVGDLLTKRDCHRLQGLAPNCTIVNMYGTTETQRAVSYCPIPPRSEQPSFLESAKDVIPAGRGMKDVQLIVVNRHGHGGLCGVGEVGEIYVRSGGLAEGYLRLEEATKAKFVNNWFRKTDILTADPVDSSSIKFYLGPRDRMYRTGDLGRYRPDGDVECIGRIDDQVKIRGFRIELGEINNMLSQHPQIRANVTLVRRDKYEEKTLVAYIVPNEEEQQRVDDPGHKKLTDNIREYLKQKLPSYSVPSVFVPMKKLPLTPNGKIDKAALPFPDTPLFRSSSVQPSSTNAEGQDQQRPGYDKLSATERTLCEIWATVIELPPTLEIEPTANFFDMGGHSILATRMIFQVRKEMAVDAPLSLVFKQPTLRGMAAALDAMSSEISLGEGPGGFASADAKGVSTEDVIEEEEEFDYSGEAKALESELPTPASPYLAYPPVLADTNRPEGSKGPTFLLTGATGFLGVFILAGLLSRHPGATVYCLTRATSPEGAFDRVKKTAEAHLLWKDEWVQTNAVKAVVGDLGKPKLGLDDNTWDKLVQEVDAIVHNGALVHWVYPYKKLRGPNVLGTIEAIKLSAAGNTPKPLVFVSSTSALDTPYYVRMCENNQVGVPESDDLSGSEHGLRSGYGQSKWVAEKLLMEARKRGLPVTIVRPGYVVGDSRSGVTNTDDFIWRLVKGCMQLGQTPNMNNVVNLCPVDYVASVVVEVISQPKALDSMVYHVVNSEGYRFQEMFDSMKSYGYQVSGIDYIKWRDSLMDFTLSHTDSALYPLLHFVLDDLPTSTKSADLDDRNTRRILEPYGISCPSMSDLMGLYFAYLIKVGFIPSPTNPEKAEKQLPQLDIKVHGPITRSSQN
ncbi:large subunit of alpha-aminoadipate reductase [Mycoemilia scoparia]|uniref:Alpha-aminoadipate reductase n=1 Tax=Mycoemilia scoparia TaxID=417184 RepID=A0A9W7ZYK8_9FUNG|nr:large subunit of alpha-aminoadipate reductase [Mycoemilia scoparia]